jgi:hypothetical protein
MSRLRPRVLHRDSEIPYVKLLDDRISLLVGNRDERFEYERAIRLFELQSWICVPEVRTIRSAGLVAATKIANSIGGEYMTLEELRLKNPTYWNMYNKVIAPYGGLSALLETESPSSFDQLMTKHRAKAKVVADLVEYRLRYALHGQGSPNGANLNHAMFFKWWPTHTLTGKRGVRAKGKCPSPRTMRSMWSPLKESAIFIYLHERHGFALSPPRADVEADRFVAEISNRAGELAELRRLFEAYAYIAEAIQRITGEQPYITIPQELPRVPIVVPAFSEAEQQIMSKYDEHHLDMWQ